MGLPGLTRGQADKRYSAVSDALTLTRLERQTQNMLRRYGSRASARAADATLFTEAWADTSAWTAPSGATAAGGRVYSSSGLRRTINVAAGARFMARATLHVTGTAGKFAYMGVTNDAAIGGTNVFGVGTGSGSTNTSNLKGTNVTGSATTPRPAFAMTAGDYLCTVLIDENHVSLSIQSVPAGQNVYEARIARSQMPSGPAINYLWLSANDTTVGGVNWGPVVTYSEATVPPASAWTVNTYPLFGAGNPLVISRADTTSGIGHLISVPGNYDPRQPSPLVLFMHQASSGYGATPWVESRWTNVLSAFDAAGYILATSDNGPSAASGGTQDKFGSQAGMDDYATVVDWTRQHFNTGALYLLGASQGTTFLENILSKRVIGGIAATASISGVYDLNALATQSSWTAPVESAYGAVSQADLATKVVGYNPVDFAGYQLRGVPQRFYLGSNDTVAPPATYATPLINKLTGYVPEANVVTLAVDHLNANLYQGSDLVSFFDTYR